jgi:hypothetical protein
MPSKRKISGKEIVNDIRAGLSDTELMQKYSVSSRGLQSIFRKLLSAKAIGPVELHERSSYDDSTVDLEEIRQSLRGYTALTATVYEVRSPEIMGTVKDVTEKHIEVTGIEAGFDETRTLVVLVGKSAKIQPIMVKAKCRWCRTDPQGAYQAYFEIVHVDDDDRKELRKLIRAMAVPF